MKIKIITWLFIQLIAVFYFFSLNTAEQGQMIDFIVYSFLSLPIIYITTYILVNLKILSNNFRLRILGVFINLIIAIQLAYLFIVV